MDFGKVEETVKLDEDGVLLCPVCRDIYTHHGKVRVYDRFGEDKDGLQIDVAGEATIKYVKSDDIPGRRDAIHIHFTCEL